MSVCFVSGLWVHPTLWSSLLWKLCVQRRWMPGNWKTAHLWTVSLLWVSHTNRSTLFMNHEATSFSWISCQSWWRDSHFHQAINKSRFTSLQYLSSQHQGFCFGSHMTQEDEFEMRLPVGQKESSFQNYNPVEVKCEIYEPQVPSFNHSDAPTTRQYDTFTLLLKVPKSTFFSSWTFPPRNSKIPASSCCLHLYHGLTSRPDLCTSVTQVNGSLWLSSSLTLYISLFYLIQIP